MEFYPIVSIPRELETILNSCPEESLKPKPPVKPIFEIPKPPKEPIIPPSGINVYGCSISLIIAFVFVIYIGTQSEIMATFFDGFGVVIMLLPILAIVFIYNYHSSGENKKRKYEEEYRDYVGKMKEYEKKKTNYKSDYEDSIKDYKLKYSFYELEKTFWDLGALDSQKDEYINNYRREKLFEFLKKNTVAPTINSNIYRKGVSESDFYNALRIKSKNFDSSVGLKIDSFYSKRTYKPDITYFDKNNLVIDIEIDEPYVGRTGEPIHYSHVDYDRDKFFNNCGWIVMRFSEKQVVTQEKECVDFIMKFINNIEKGIRTDLENDIKKEPKWTKEKAHKLAFARYRNTYLNTVLIEKLQDELIEDVFIDTDKDEIEDDGLPF